MPRDQAAVPRGAEWEWILRVASIVGVVLGVLFGATAAVVAVARPLILREVVLPIARGYSPGGVVPVELVETLEALLVGLAPALGFIGAFVLLAAIVIPGLYRRLPTKDAEPPSPKVTAPVGRGEIGMLVAVLLLAIGLRLPRITRGLGFDEIFTARWFVEVPSLWTTVSRYHAFANHVGYSVVAWIAHTLFGRHEWALRAPALVLGLGGIAATWWFARAQASSAVGLIAALILAVSPMHVQYSVSARGYTGAALFTVVATALFLRLLERPHTKDSILFAASGAAAIWFHMYSAFAIGVLGLYVVILAARNPPAVTAGTFRTLIMAFAALAALATFLHAAVLPKLLINLGERGRGQFNPQFPIELLRDLGGRTPVLAIGATLLFAVGLFTLGIERRPHLRHVRWLVLFLLVIPFLVAWSLHPRDLYTRFFFFYLGFYALAVAAGCAWLWQLAGRAQAIIAIRVTLVIAFVITTSALARTAVRDVPEEAFRTVARALMQNAQPGTVLCSIGAGADLLAYYVEGPLLLPQTLDELRAETDGKVEVRCAYRERYWTTAEHRRAAAWLAAQGTLQSYGEIVTYTLRRPPQ